MDLLGRFIDIPKESFFLFGPRGTGKSTWIKRCFSQAEYVDLLRPEDYRAFSARPERFRQIVLGSRKKAFIVDEIQKVPSLLDVIHELIETGPARQFILTGSSARKLKRAGVDLLAGRALTRRMHPFMAGEVSQGFSLEKALRIGLLPLAYLAQNPEEVLNAYVGLYVREEVQMEGLVRNLGNFSRFLEAVSFSHGSILNVSNVARECEVGRKTVEGYIDILEDLLLCFQIPVFTKRAKRETVAHGKFYLFDAGVYRSLRPAGPLDRREEIEGAALEGLVAQHLRAWSDYNRRGASLYYWRTQAGSEVDFVLYGKEDFCAFEVKNADKVRNEDLRPLKTFLSDYPESRGFLIYRGKQRLKIHDVLCLPAEDFLLSMKPGVGLREALEA